MTTVVGPSSRITYPDTDGQPTAENTLQFEWIVTIKEGLEHVFAADPDVFVAGDLFWYPAEGHPDVRMAPDVMVVFGRPKGHRPSYRQWEEGGVAPQIVFEVLSPGNRAGEMVRKAGFYRRHGAEEYYIYDPDPARLELSGFVNRGDDWEEVPRMDGHVSPRLGVRFGMGDEGLRLVGPDGRPFLSFQEWTRRAEQERQRAEAADRRAEEERRRADQERARAEHAAGEVERLRDRLRSLGQDPG